MAERDAEADVDASDFAGQAERLAVAVGPLSAADLLGRVDAGKPISSYSPEGKDTKKEKKDKKKRKKPDTTSESGSETDTDDTVVSSSEDGFEDSVSDLESSDDGARASKKAKKDKEAARRGDPGEGLERLIEEISPKLSVGARELVPVVPFNELSEARELWASRRGRRKDALEWAK